MSIPNMLTWSRLVLILPFMFCMLNGLPVLGAIVFAIGSITDFLDGFIARKFNQSTQYGAVLDPIVDKLFYLSVLLVFIQLKYITILPVFIIIFRELFMTGMRSASICLGEQFPADIFGKSKAVLQYISFFVILYFGKSCYSTVAIWVVAVLTIASSRNYLIKVCSCIQNGMEE